MNVPEAMVEEISYDVHFGLNEGVLARMFGQSESLYAYATLQFEDYSKMVFEYFDPAERLERRKTVFPEDCRKAFELGVRMVGGGSSDGG
jgi:hypothetical protein